uniref:SET and MYND domain containing 2 n=1 Tax=Myotis myotis TaxID=51298 RepID=A0A7J7STN4_MYOMY|nr:SET and MYND domain containing 2 [Myotis myotis]
MRAEGDGLERFCSPGKGRGLRALQPFQVGDLLFSCPAYACVLTVNERGNHCEHCFASPALPAADLRFPPRSFTILNIHVQYLAPLLPSRALHLVFGEKPQGH